MILQLFKGLQELVKLQSLQPFVTGYWNLPTKRKDSDVKTILASAFQNDTIEHLASKVYTHGLPTVKVGKKTMGVRAEERFISDFEKDLQKK